MKTRLHFKLIAILITTALTGLIIFQGYWLKGLYNTLYVQMESNILDAMRIADYKELFFRMEEYKKEKGDVEYSEKLSFGNDAPEENEEPADSTGRRVTVEQEDINLAGINLKDQVDKALDELLTALGGLEELVLQGMHDQFDSIVPIRSHTYDSLLVNELKNRGIETRMQLHAIYKKEKGSIGYMLLGKNHPGMEKDTTSSVFDWKEAKFYDYPIKIKPMSIGDVPMEETINDSLSYRLYIKSPARLILHQMGGILASSFLVLVIIIITFIYLLRTILRQKTEEELKTDFTNNMTHELKTPISVSYAAVDSMLNFGEPVSERQQKYLTIVKEQLTHLTGLVEQILSLSVENRNSFRLQPEPINLSQLTGTLIEQSKLKADKKINFTTEIPDDLEVIADKTHLYNILNNLIDNAQKYADKETCLIRLKAENKQDRIDISVTDNGPGISIAHQSRIFDKFYRIPNGNIHNVKGHGLGLYYVKDMMSKHAGSINIESVIGKGTTFTLHFKAGK